MRLTARPSALAACALATALTLSACGILTDAPPTDDATTEAGQAGDTSAPESEAEPTPTVLDVDWDLTAIDLGPAGTVTPPGTAVALGQPIWLNQTVTYDGQEITGAVGLSVREIRPLDPAMFEEFSNADEFEGYTPYAVITQHQWLYDIPAGSDPETVDLFPQKEDGSQAEYLTSSFAGMFASPGDLCGLQLPPYDEATKTLVSCWVALSPDLPVTKLEYNGEEYTSVMAAQDNQYFNAPIIWS